MNIHEFGKNNADVIVLLHPLGARWDVFNYVIPTLEKQYHLVIPARNSVFAKSAQKIKNKQ